MCVCIIHSFIHSFVFFHSLILRSGLCRLLSLSRSLSRSLSLWTGRHHRTLLHRCLDSLWALGRPGLPAILMVPPGGSERDTPNAGKTTLPGEQDWMERGLGGYGQPGPETSCCR